MPTLAEVQQLVDQVRDARPEALDRVVSGWHQAGSGAAEMLARATVVDRDTGAALLNDRQEIYDAAAATTRTRAATGDGGERFRRVAEAVGVVRNELSRTRTAVLAAWEQLRAELAAVDAAGARLSAAAPSMTQPEVYAQATGLRTRSEQALANCSDRIARLLDDYSGVLVSRTGVLAELGYVAAPSATETAADGIPVPPVGRPPAEVNAWWPSLAPEQRADLIARQPRVIGNLDGIPVTDRDQANRVVLAEERVRLEGQQRDLTAQLGQIDQQQAAPSSPYVTSPGALDQQRTAVLSQLDAVARRLDGLDRLDDRLKDAGSGRLPAYLMGFQPEVGLGRAAVAVGNPDKADNVVTHVPGMNSQLNVLPGDVERADATANAARQADLGQQTAVVAWLGYDAPQGVPAATTTSYADNAQAALRNFQDGLRVTHDGPPSHNTIVAHSYGTTVVGHTTRDGPLDADAIVFAGSPGVGVGNVAELHRPSGTVYSTTSADDIIRLANLTIDPVHGPSPSEPEFGAHVFQADPRGDHSDYWRPGNRSLESIGRIAVGKEP